MKNHTTKVQKPLLKANFSVGASPASPERGGAAAAAEGLTHIVGKESLFICNISPKKTILLSKRYKVFQQSNQLGQREGHIWSL